METFMRCLLGSGCLAGGCCAIGIPVALSSGTSVKDESLAQATQTVSFSDSCPTGGGHSGNQVSFGATEAKRVCLVVNNNNFSSNDSSIKSLIQKNGNKNQSGKGDESDGGKSNCLQGSSKGAITAQGSGKQYYGKCGTDQQTSTSGGFIEIVSQGSDNNIPKIRGCKDNCGSSPTDSSGIKQYSTLSEGSGHDVSFSTA